MVGFGKLGTDFNRLAQGLGCRLVLALRDLLHALVVILLGLVGCRGGASAQENAQGHNRDRHHYTASHVSDAPDFRTIAQAERWVQPQDMSISDAGKRWPLRTGGPTRRSVPRSGGCRRCVPVRCPGGQSRSWRGG